MMILTVHINCIFRNLVVSNLHIYARTSRKWCFLIVELWYMLTTLRLNTVLSGRLRWRPYHCRNSNSREIISFRNKEYVRRHWFTSLLNSLFPKYSTARLETAQGGLESHYTFSEFDGVPNNLSLQVSVGWHKENFMLIFWSLTSSQLPFAIAVRARGVLW